LLVAAAVIALCYGGGFGTMPAFASDVFGAKNAGTIYGAMLTAWSAGAIVGPLFIAGVPYRMALPLIAGSSPPRPPCRSSLWLFNVAPWLLQGSEIVPRVLTWTPPRLPRLAPVDDETMVA
jgi:hypothetical protein